MISYVVNFAFFLIKPLFRFLEPEWAHKIALNLVKKGHRVFKFDFFEKISKRRLYSIWSKI